MDEAIAHINHYGSHHTDAIVTNDLTAARRFTAAVDSAAVLVNASTRFNDGHELGLGAEIGISTDKFHARGPCGLLELTSYKYVVLGKVRSENEDTLSCRLRLSGLDPLISKRRWSARNPTSWCSAVVILACCCHC